MQNYKFMLKFEIFWKKANFSSKNLTKSGYPCIIHKKWDKYRIFSRIFRKKFDISRNLCYAISVSGVVRTKNYITAYSVFHIWGLTMKTKLLFKNEHVGYRSSAQNCLRAIPAGFVLIHGFLPPPPRHIR